MELDNIHTVHSWQEIKCDIAGCSFLAFIDRICPRAALVMEKSGPENVTDKIQRLQREKAMLTLARKEIQKALRKENRRMACLCHVVSKISAADLRHCVDIARAKPKAQAKPKASPHVGEVHGHGRNDC